MKSTFIALSFLCSMTLSIHAQPLLEVDGSIIIKDDTSSNPVAGTIRFSGTDFQGWDGSKWISSINW